MEPKPHETPEQATKDGELHYCESCKKVQPIFLTCLNPDEDDEPSLIVCHICKEAIGFIENI